MFATTSEEERKDARGRRDNKSFHVKDTRVENEEQTERPGGLFQPLSVCCSEEKLAGDRVWSGGGQCTEW